MIFTANKCTVCACMCRGMSKDLCEGCYDILAEVRPFLSRAQDYRLKNMCWL